MLAQDDIERVRRGWAVAATLPRETAAAFHAHLCARDPSARALFAEDMETRERKLMQTLDLIVDALDSPLTLARTASDLALGHVSCGVTPDRHAHVGGALIDALGDLMGGDFTADDRAAWQRVHRALVEERAGGAHRASPS